LLGLPQKASGPVPPTMALATSGGSSCPLRSIKPNLAVGNPLTKLRPQNPEPGSRPGQSRAGITVRPDLRRRPEGARCPERGPCPRRAGGVSGRACDSGGAKGALACWTRPARSRCSHRDLMCEPICLVLRRFEFSWPILCLRLLAIVNFWQAMKN